MDEIEKIFLTSITSFVIGGGAVTAYISWKNSKREAGVQKDIAKATLAGNLLREQLQRVTTARERLQSLKDENEISLIIYNTRTMDNPHKLIALCDLWRNDDTRVCKINALYREIRPYLRDNSFKKSYFVNSEDEKNYDGKEILTDLFSPMFHSGLQTDNQYEKLLENSYRQKILKGTEKNWKETEPIFEAYEVDLLYAKTHAASSSGRTMWYFMATNTNNEPIERLIDIARDYDLFVAKFESSISKTLESERKAIISELHHLNI